MMAIEEKDAFEFEVMLMLGRDEKNYLYN